MKLKLILLLLISPITISAQNIIFNPGFDMTPWDTGWVKSIHLDSAKTGSASVSITKEVKSNSSSISSPYCCNVLSEIFASGSGGGTGSGWARCTLEVTMTQTFDPISNCLFKAHLTFFGSGLYGPKYGLFGESSIQLRINGNWYSIWSRYYDDGNINNWTEVSQSITYGSVTGLRFRNYSTGENSGSSSGWIFAVGLDFKIDDVEITAIPVEETDNSKSTIRNPDFSVLPNPFTISTTIKLSSASGGLNSLLSTLSIYDISGKLVESHSPYSPHSTNSTHCISLGKNLRPGIYFLSINNSKLIKIIKLK